MKNELKELNDLLSRSKGPLDDRQIVEGLHLCFKNAQDLHDEGKILLENGRRARAFSLFVLSLEELAKVPLLVNAVLLKKSKEDVWARFWDAFNSHKLKQNIWAIYGRGPIPSDPERRKHYEHFYPKEAPSLEKIKQLSFYVDYVGDETIIPEAFFSRVKGLVGLVMKMSEDRLKAFSIHSTFAGSKRIVQIANMMRIEGKSQQEVEALLLDSIAAVRAYHESGKPFRANGR